MEYILTAIVVLSDIVAAEMRSGWDKLDNDAYYRRVGCMSLLMEQPYGTVKSKRHWFRSLKSLKWPLSWCKGSVLQSTCPFCYWSPISQNLDTQLQQTVTLTNGVKTWQMRQENWQVGGLVYFGLSSTSSIGAVITMRQRMIYHNCLFWNAKVPSKGGYSRTG